MLWEMMTNLTQLQKWKKKKIVGTTVLCLKVHSKAHLDLLCTFKHDLSDFMYWMKQCERYSSSNAHFFFLSVPKKYLLAAFKTVNLSCNRTVAHQCAAKGRHRSTWKFFRSLNLMAASMYTNSIHRDTVGRQTPLSEKAKQHKDVTAWLVYKAVKCLRCPLSGFISILQI